MQHPNRAADSHEIRPLTGIRGFAAAWVVLFHFNDSWVMLLPSLHPCIPLASRGALGVDFFFILSGFILSYVYSAGASKLGFAEYRRFLWFRLARVFPNHVATLTFLALLVVGARYFGIALSGDYPISGLPFQLTMTHAWPFVRGGYWNFPSWSISAEWFAYLFMFPVVWFVLRLDFRTRTSFMLGYGILSIWLFLLSTIPIPSCLPVLKVSCEFVAGGLFFSAFLRAERVTRFCQRYASAIFVIVLGISCLSPLGTRFASPVIVLLFPALLLGLTSETSMISTLLSSSVALWFGRVSYALYMSHAIAEKLLKVILPSKQYMDSPFAIRVLVLLANVFLILLCATTLYYLIEIPVRNYLRRLTKGFAKHTVKPDAQREAGT